MISSNDPELENAIKKEAKAIFPERHSFCIIKDRWPNDDDIFLFQRRLAAAKLDNPSKLEIILEGEETVSPALSLKSLENILKELPDNMQYEYGKIVGPRDVDKFRDICAACLGFREEYVSPDAADRETVR